MTRKPAGHNVVILVIGAQGSESGLASLSLLLTKELVQVLASFLLPSKVFCNLLPTSASTRVHCLWYLGMLLQFSKFIVSLVENVDINIFCVIFHYVITLIAIAKSIGLFYNL